MLHAPPASLAMLFAKVQSVAEAAEALSLCTAPPREALLPTKLEAEICDGRSEVSGRLLSNRSPAPRTVRVPPITPTAPPRPVLMELSVKVQRSMVTAVENVLITAPIVELSAEVRVLLHMRCE